MRHGKGHTGFTLVELLLAMGMIALIVSALFGTWRGTSQSWLRTLPQQSLQQQGYALLERIASQIRCCPGSPQESSDANDDIHTVFVSHPETGDPLLQLVTARSLLFGQSPTYGYVQATYKIEPHTGRLLYQEQDWPDVFESTEQDWHILSEQIQEIQLHFVTGEKILNRWDADEVSGLPDAVHILLKLQSARGDSWEEELIVRPVCQGGAQ